MAAIHAGQLFGVGNLFEVAVAAHAIQGRVRGSLQSGGIETGRHASLPAPGTRSGIVAAGAIFIFRQGRLLGRDKGGKCQEGQAKTDKRSYFTPESHVCGPMESSLGV
jgi:hypothetical protein